MQPTKRINQRGADHVMGKIDIANLQQQSKAQITKQLPSLDRGALVELAAREAESSVPRVTLQSAIDKQLVALDELAADPEANTKPKPPVVSDQAKPVDKPAGKLPVTDYRHPDYAGALSGEQADWRVAHIKPVREARTK